MSDGWFDLLIVLGVLAGYGLYLWGYTAGLQHATRDIQAQREKRKP